MSFGVAHLDRKVLSLDPAKVGQALGKRRDHFSAVRPGEEDADASHAAGLRTSQSSYRQRSRGQQELAPLHSITRSARTKNDRGILMPSVLAVLRLTTNSNLVGCSIGSSAGVAPLRILSTYSAARRHMCALLGP